MWLMFTGVGQWIPGGSLYPSVHFLGFSFLFVVFGHALRHMAS